MARPPVDPSNAGQLDAWDGEQGEFWTEHADRFDDAVAELSAGFLAAAAPAPGERVLDVGCGSGRTSREVATRVAPGGEVLGVDLSSGMLALARARAAAEGLTAEGLTAEGLTPAGPGASAAGASGVDTGGADAGGRGTVRFEQADAQAHPFPAGGFDLVLSRHGSMFFGDPPAAFANLARALRPGGRLALLVWRTMAENEFFTAPRAAVALGRELPAPPPDGPGPFSLADPDRVRALLTGAGLTGVALQARDVPMTVGRDAAQAEAFLAGQLAWALRELSEADRERARAGLRDLVAARLGPHGVRLGSAAWVVTARKP
jgi:SAM-dependent methyltransferase